MRFVGDLLLDFDCVFLGDLDYLLTAGVFLRFRIFSLRSSIAYKLVSEESISTFMVSGGAVCFKGFGAVREALLQEQQLVSSSL